ncbi:MAG: cysteine--tRNA ligase [Candidatus Woesearchaeota archaeon]
MVLKLYNSLSKEKQEFKSLIPNLVRMYNCGPTVYSYAHIGNFRAYIFADLLRRYLEFKGYEVKQIMNITDVGHLTDDSDEGEDKLELASKKENKHPLEIAKFYTDIFLNESKLLNIQEPFARPKATEYVQEMIQLIEVLLEKDFAYISNGNIYFNIEKFPEYGKLSGNNLDNLNKNRVEKDPNKKNQNDFVLWFANSKYKNHIQKWDSPWGEGYPGWHSECCVMSAKLLSDAFKDNKFQPELFQTLDIHTGGIDNKFPHHECEIAQVESATGKLFANFWLHNGWLLGTNGEKLSKSKGTLLTISNLIEEGFKPKSIRYLLLSTHYRQQLIFDRDNLKSASNSLERLNETLIKLNDLKEEREYNESIALQVNIMMKQFEEFMDDDLNISGALGVIFETIKTLNISMAENLIGKIQAQEIIKKFYKLDEVLGIIGELDNKIEITKEIEILLEKRRQARENKDWETSDKIRDELKAKGIEVRDSKEGQTIKYI